MKQLKYRPVKAFTLIESLLVLLVISVLSLITISNYQKEQAKFGELLFIEALEMNIRDAQRFSALNETPYLLGIEDNQFYMKSEADNKLLWRYSLPENIQCARFNIRFKENGNISSIERAFTVRLAHLEKQISYQFLIGSGQYKKEEKNL
ncbi:MAG: prepilin-type N-terminal cleavage/methylation domain-containing protein [Streptococcaceae bacterium]|jgi:competence protein ComGD|nr:prepilin-type N-terminal cleavage/methylation domain-containing protein [Streptococcaceae bacterium]